MIFVVIMSTPRSLMEFDLQVRVMRETYRKLLGIRDGLEADARFLPQPSTSAAASSSSEFIYREFKDPTISPIVHRKLFPSFIDTQLFTPPSLIQTPRDATLSSDSDDTIILEDAPQSSQDMTDVTIVIQDASQDVTDSEKDITIEDTCTY